jgi:CheY-like chemotaxis protein
MPKGWEQSDIMTYTVLFADDELDKIQGLIESVRAEGCNILTCRDASTAIELVKNGNIDCLVIDIMMDPGKDMVDVDPLKAGLYAVDKILAFRNKQAIVCLSVISDQKIIRTLKQKGVLYLRKGETSVNVAWRIIHSKMTGLYTRDNGFFTNDPVT